MAAIDQYLRQILIATYGEEVRHSIHDAIKQNYMDVSDSVAQANAAADLAEQALADASTVIDEANAAAQTAETAAQDASTAVTNANAAVEAANTAVTNANKAVTNANAAVESANAAATSANEAASGANTAAQNANEKATLANTAAQNADTARNAANTAATNANEKATLANTAATNADTKAGLANDAADRANEIADTIDSKVSTDYETTSGNPITVETDSAQVAEKTVIHLEPKQDLHGYDHPWPAGGGKNLLPMTVAGIKAVNSSGTWSGNSWTKDGVTFTIMTDNSGNVTGINVNGTSSATVYFKLSVLSNTLYSESCIASLESNISPCTFADSYSGKFNLSSGTQNFTGGESTIGPSIRILNGVSVSNVLVKPMICLSTVTDATFTPYSNICPISGWTGANIWDDPVYVGTVEWNQLAQNGNFESDEYWNSPNATRSVTNNVYSFTPTGQFGAVIQNLSNRPFVSGHKYILSVDVKGESERLVCAGISDNVNFTYFKNINATTNWQNFTFMFSVITSVSYTSLHNIFVRDNGISGFVNIDVRNFTFFDITQMFGSTIADNVYAMEQATAGAGVAWFRNLFPKDYYPYNSGETTTVSAVNGNPYHHIEIAFPSEAGTVYGGTLTIEKDGSGELVVDKVMEFLNGSWYKPADNIFARTIIIGEDAYGIAPSDQLFCEVLKSTSVMWQLLNDFEFNFGQNISGGGACIAVRDSTVSSVADFKEKYKDYKFVYPLLTPLTYTLTAEQVKLLKGLNHIFTDATSLDLTHRKGSFATLDDVADISALFRIIADDYEQTNIKLEELFNAIDAYGPQEETASEIAREILKSGAYFKSMADATDTVKEDE